MPQQEPLGASEGGSLPCEPRNRSTLSVVQKEKKKAGKKKKKSAVLVGCWVCDPISTGIVVYTRCVLLLCWCGNFFRANIVRDSAAETALGRKNQVKGLVCCTNYYHYCYEV